MRRHDPLWESDGRSSRGGAVSPVSPEDSTGAEPEQPVADGKTPTDTETGGNRISGPGPNNLTRGLP